MDDVYKDAKYISMVDEASKALRSVFFSSKLAETPGGRTANATSEKICGYITAIR